MDQENQIYTDIPQTCTCGGIGGVGGSGGGTVVEENQTAAGVEKPKKKSKKGFGLVIWMLIGAVLTFVIPPVGIGLIALGVPFLFIGKKKD